MLLCCYKVVKLCLKTLRDWTPLGEYLPRKAPQPGRQTALKVSPIFEQRRRKHQYLHKGIPPICSLNYIERSGYTFSSDNDGAVGEAVLEFSGVHLEEQSWQPGHSRWVKEIQQSLSQEEGHAKLPVQQHSLAACSERHLQLHHLRVSRKKGTCPLYVCPYLNTPQTSFVSVLQ